MTDKPSSADIGEPANWRESAIVRLIDILRSEEGDSVTILSDNPDFNGQPNCAVICNGDWTGWVDKRFAADTVLDALSMAMTEKKLPAPRKVIAESNGHHWVERFHLVCCRDCGFVRRSDDQNKPCKGVVTVGPRASLQPATPVEAARSREPNDEIFAQALGDICDDLGCARDNEAALVAIDDLRKRSVDLTDAQLDDLRSHIRGAQPGQGTYDYELGSGWRCFHCGEMFRTWGGASLHFGKPADKRPACEPVDVAQCAWKPIETAPRDGTRILATGGGLDNEIEIVDYNVKVGAWNSTNYTLDDRDDEAEGYNRPTLWRPLPIGPSLPSTDRGGK